MIIDSDTRYNVILRMLFKGERFKFNLKVVCI